ncbi:MAG: hypothetical protein AAF206_07865 [Bacteroidota bacterium]
MKNGTNWYDYIRLLSLDVVLGALFSGGMLVGLLGVSMPWVWWMVLPLSVWVMYTADHLLDARRLGDQAHTPRHLFHHQHRQSISIAWLIAFVLCSGIAPFFMPFPMILFGLGMGLLVLIHFGLIKLIGERTSRWLMKEVGVGGIYVLGIWGAPLILHPTQVFAAVWWMMGQFFLLAMINLLAFSMYESAIDELDGHTSFVRAIGPKTTQFIIGLMIFFIAGIGYFLLLVKNCTMLLPVQSVFALMTLILGLISFAPKWFTQNERYRIWGDMVFLLPIVLWI